MNYHAGSLGVTMFVIPESPKGLSGIQNPGAVYHLIGFPQEFIQHAMRGGNDIIVASCGELTPKEINLILI
jgi:hypothetical protein